MLGTRGQYLVASICPHFLGGEDPVTEAGEAKPTCPAQGLLQNEKISSGAMKAT